MGCDIHIYIEYRCGNGMPWQADDHHVRTWEDRCIESFEDDESKWCSDCLNGYETCENGYADWHQVSAISRDYNLFGELASVRGESSSSRLALGLPDDVSLEIKTASDDYGDGHSHSYISIEEFRKIGRASCRERV